MKRTSLHRAMICLIFLFALPVYAGDGDLRLIPAPGELGPWDVGRVSFTLVDPAREDRSLEVDVWYPVDAEDARGEASVYDLVFAQIPSAVALDSVPVSDQGPHPVVVFSHGSFGIRFQSFFLTETLASHGFVVVAPDHTGNTAADLLFGTEVPFEESAIDRPQDISFVITSMLERSDTPGDEFEDRIDSSRIGMSGHSFGGFTSLAMGSGYEANPPDPRVVAIAPLAPASGVLTDEALATIDLPALIVGGTSDITTPIDPESTRPFDLMPALPRYRVDIIDAGHQSFTDICQIADALLAAGVPQELIDLILGSVDEGCAPELIPIEEAHRVTNVFVVSFMRYFVAGDARYRSYFSRRYVTTEEPGVEFFKVRGFTGP